MEGVEMENQEAGIRMQDAESRSKDAESRKQDEVSDEVRARLMMISQSIKAIGEMAKVGISFCIVIPGYGIKPDDRLVSNYCPNSKERSTDSISQEIAENLTSMEETYMMQLLHAGLTKDAVTGYVEHIYQTAKERFLEKAAGVGDGAGPMNGDAAD
jgi:hypothetical protein